MKLDRKVIRDKEDRGLWIKCGDVYEITCSNIIFCCDEMENAWSDDFIKFGEFDSNLNRDENVNISKCYPYPEGAVWHEMAIKFCPFCAEIIEIKDVVDEDTSGGHQ